MDQPSSQNQIKDTQAQKVQKKINYLARLYHRKHNLSAFNLIVIVGITLLTSFYAGAQTMGVFQTASNAVFRTGKSPGIQPLGSGSGNEQCNSHCHSSEMFGSCGDNNCGKGNRPEHYSNCEQGFEYCTQAISGCGTDVNSCTDDVCRDACKIEQGSCKNEGTNACDWGQRLLIYKNCDVAGCVNRIAGCLEDVACPKINSKAVPTATPTINPRGNNGSSCKLGPSKNCATQGVCNYVNPLGECGQGEAVNGCPIGTELMGYASCVGDPCCNGEFARCRKSDKCAPGTGSTNTTTPKTPGASIPDTQNECKAQGNNCIKYAQCVIQDWCDAPADAPKTEADCQAKGAGCMTWSLCGTKGWCNSTVTPALGGAAPTTDPKATAIPDEQPQGPHVQNPVNCSTGKSCAEDYPESCTASDGSAGTKWCHKKGTCTANGGGEACSFGAGSYCESCVSNGGGNTGGGNTGGGNTGGGNNNQCNSSHEPGSCSGAGDCCSGMGCNGTCCGHCSK